MDCNVLLDAIGMVDDVFLTEENVPVIRPARRISVLIAAIVAVLAMMVTALAVSEDFREVIFSIFRIETPEVPPAPETAKPTQPQAATEATRHTLREIGVVNIDDAVEAFYFSGEGFVYQMEGGFYTSEHREGDMPPRDPAFWEVTEDGIVEAVGYRVDFPFTHKGKTFQIIIDYAILNGKLCHLVWPQGLDEDPYGNGWNAVLLADRTDVMLLSIPVLQNEDLTTDYFLLDLATQEATPLLMGSEREDIVVDICWFTEDLRYAIIYGWIPFAQKSEVWFRDMEQGTVRTMRELVGVDVYLAPYFLDNETIVYKEKLEDNRIRIGRYHIPTGIRQILVQDAAYSDYRSMQHSGYYSAYGMLNHGDGEYELIDLRTNERLSISGLTSRGMQTSESPLSKRIMISYYQTDGMYRKYSSIGLLDPDTGILKVLERKPSDKGENFWGWLGENTIVLTNHDDNGKYCVYVYRFE